MTTSRKRKVLVQNVSDNKADEAILEYAQADVQEKMILAELELKIQKIRNNYQGRLLQLKEVKNNNFNILETWARENESLFMKKKSVDMVHGTVGYRRSTPKLKVIKGHTWANVLTLLKENNPQYVRTKEEVNKEQLLVDREKEKAQQLMKKIKVEVAQDETFYVVTKEKEIEGCA